MPGGNFHEKLEEALRIKFVVLNFIVQYSTLVPVRYRPNAASGGGKCSSMGSEWLR